MKRRTDRPSLCLERHEKRGDVVANVRPERWVRCFPALNRCTQVATAYIVEEPCAPLQHTLSGV
jgi:hypothetical protein